MGVEINKNHIYTQQFIGDQEAVPGDKCDLEFMIRKLIYEYKQCGTKTVCGKKTCGQKQKHKN